MLRRHTPMLHRPAFTYRDELALVRHLVDALEGRLAGRHETRFLRIIPSDHCHLGVLGPRDPLVEEPEPLDLIADENLGEATVAPSSRPSHGHGPAEATVEESPEDVEESLHQERSNRSPQSSVAVFGIQHDVLPRLSVSKSTPYRRRKASSSPSPSGLRSIPSTFRRSRNKSRRWAVERQIRIQMILLRLMHLEPASVCRSWKRSSGGWLRCPLSMSGSIQRAVTSAW